MLPGFEQLLAQCAPQVAPDTMTAIVRVESGGNPLAMNVNGSKRLARQPSSKQEAAAWAAWLIEQGYSVDLGLAQVNSRNLQRLGVSSEQMFEPCPNLKAGAQILSENYAGASKRFGTGPKALRAAISAYNTGNYRGGFANGYVAKVDASAGISSSAEVPLLVAVSATKNSARRTNGKKRDEPQVFTYGSGGEFQNLGREAGSPLVVWVQR